MSHTHSLQNLSTVYIQNIATLTHMKASTLTLLIIVHMLTVDVCSSSGHWMLNATQN